MAQSLIDQILQQTKDHTIHWQNYKDTRPKETLDLVQYRRLMAATKYPKRVLPVQDGYNKYQSYYAFHGDLVLCLTKGKRDSQLLLIAGNVTPNDQKYYDTQLTVLTNEQTHNKLDELFQLIHQPRPNITSNHQTIDAISQQLQK